MTNAEIAAVFEDIAHLLEMKRENIFKIRAYRKVVKSISELKEDVAKMAAEGRLREIPGAGEAIVKKINEMVNTGRLAYYERLKAEMGEQKLDS
ncbi:MAG: hypothetical protein HYX79_08575 [Chloroflexi bacterium]|nr:hypothetical protein [Chloroflexota bacterium]